MLDHIAIAVKNPENFIEIFKKLGFEYEKMEKVESEEVVVHFLKKNNFCIELLEPLKETSRILNFIEKKGETFHHIALKVENISSEMENLKRKGFNFINENPKTGAQGKKISFIHPKSTGGILVEICEGKDENK